MCEVSAWPNDQLGLRTPKGWTQNYIFEQVISKKGGEVGRPVGGKRSKRIGKHVHAVHRSKGKDSVFEEVAITFLYREWELCSVSRGVCRQTIVASNNPIRPHPTAPFISAQLFFSSRKNYTNVSSISKTHPLCVHTSQPCTSQMSVWTFPETRWTPT